MRTGGPTDGQTDTTKPVDAFRSFENAPKISTFFPHCIYVLYVSQKKQHSLIGFYKRDSK